MMRMMRSLGLTISLVLIHSVAVDAQSSGLGEVARTPSVMENTAKGNLRIFLSRLFSTDNKTVEQWAKDLSWKRT